MKCKLRDSHPQWAEVLRDIGRRFRGRLALNADVVRPGVVRVGDKVKLVR